MKLSLAEIALACGARLEAPASIASPGTFVAQGYSIDSRTINAGELFFAVRGDRLDGHNYVAAALERGALGAVVSISRVQSLSDEVLLAPLLIVEDPLQALQTSAAHVRRHWGGRVVGVTGSAGKTSTKDAVAAALGVQFRVLKSLGNLNNAFGLPLQLLRLEPEHEFAVVEMGMNHAGEIAQLARIAVPDWGVITNVGMAHAENFPDGQAGIARAKYELVEALPSSGVAFLNCDDPYVAQFGRDFAGKVVYFGAGPCADPQITAIHEDVGQGSSLHSGLILDVLSGEHTFALHLRMLGRHNASNAMAALAVAREAGVPEAAAIQALEALTPGDKRGQLLRYRGATIINDSYNSNPEALRSMILALAAQPAQRRILVAGEMLELGELAPVLHADCGRVAAEAGIDVVIGVRGNAEQIVLAASAAGVPGLDTLFLPDADAAGQWLKENLRPGDVALVKGSRGVRLERALEPLVSDESEA
jgi:UDP-N-acetylmuramoyl-tripeptide--D-alanyl-D-alanine ligase